MHGLFLPSFNKKSRHYHALKLGIIRTFNGTVQYMQLLQPSLSNFPLSSRRLFTSSFMVDPLAYSKTSDWDRAFPKKEPKFFFLWH